MSEVPAPYRHPAHRVTLATDRLGDEGVGSGETFGVTFSMNPSTGNGGTCYGDSGGPHFLGGKDVENRTTFFAVTVTGDRCCRSTDKTYHLRYAQRSRALLTELMVW